MGERKGQNFYYPPDFDPAKHRNLNAYHGTHALRERARKLDQGITIIRFEMPYNIWCLGCGKHVAMGVRYNSEKTKVGMYYTTPIYKFRMKCHLCDNYYEIQTDPQNFEYVIISGARRKEQRWDPAENEQLVTDDRDTKRKLATDPMFKLEHTVNDRSKKETMAPNLQQLEEDASLKHKDDFRANQAARKIFRTEKKEIAEREKEVKDLLDRHSLTGGEVKLLGESEEDKRTARLLKYSAPISFDDRQRAKMCDISSATIFGGKSAGRASSSSSSSSSDKLNAKKHQMKMVANQLKRKRQKDISFPVTEAVRAKHQRLSSGDLGIRKKEELAVEEVEEKEKEGGLSLLTAYSNSDSSDNSS